MSVVANVAINVDSRGATQKLREVQQAAQQAQRALEGIGGASGAQPFRAASSSASELIGVLGRLSAAYLGLRTAQQAVQAGIQREESVRRLTFLAKGYGEVARAQELAAQSGRAFGLSATESNQQFAQLYGRLRPLNVSLEDINAAFVGFNTAAKVSGATTAESAGALLQLTQALGSGVLRGQELNSVLEQAPGLVVALTKELGRPVSEIRKLAEEGEITSDVVIRALKRAGTEGADELAAAMSGPAQAVKNLQNEFENFQVAATQDLIPMVVEAMKGLRDVLISLGPVIRGIGGIAAQTLGTIADLINAATKPGATAAAIAIRGGRLPLAGLGGMSGAGELFKGTSGAFGTGLTGLKAEAAFLAKQRRQPVTDVLLQLMQNRLQRMETPAQTQTPDLPSTFVSSGGTAGARRSNKGKSDAERLAEQIAKQKAAAAEVLAVEKGRLQVAETADPLHRQITEAIVKQNDIQREYANKLNESKSAEETINLQMAERKALQTNALELQRALNAEVDQLTQPLTDLVKASSERLAFENKYQELLAQGINPELAKEYAQLELAAEKQSELLTLRLAELEAAKAKLDAESGVAKALQEQIDKIKEILKLQKGQVDKSKQETEEEKRKREEREKKEEKEKKRAEELNALYNGIASTIENGIVNAIDAGITSLLDGTKSLSDALKEIASGVLKEIASILIKFAVRQAFSALGFAEGGYLSGGFQAFADGGLVTSPTMGLIGEGGEPEYVIPASKMRGAMARYAAGARGSAVIPGNGTSGGGGAMGSGSGAIDVRYTVERINSVDYVTADQFQRGMRQAAQQGAEQGERRALGRLRNSPATRNRVGV